MKMLSPPVYPDCPEAPLKAFGLAFSEEIARSVIAAVYFENLEKPHENDVRVAASLTMLEAFHPRDHLECMMAAQGAALHSMIMECHRRAMHPETDEPMAIKLRGNVAQLSRVFSALVRDFERRHAKPLPPVPPPEGEAPETPPPETGPVPLRRPCGGREKPLRRRRVRTATRMARTSPSHSTW